MEKIQIARLSFVAAFGGYRLLGGIIILSLSIATGSTQIDHEQKIVQRRGSGAVSFVKYENGAWQMMVDGNPYFVKGMAYSADPVGMSPSETNEWMHHDFNKNGRIDGPYDAWVDANNDDFQDFEENAEGDFSLLKEMGCNTVRIYHPDNINKELLRDLYTTYGIRVIMGHFFGAYGISSGADWSRGTDYTNKEHRENMKKDVRKMVEEYKDEPFVLLWMLGNENDAVGSYENSTFNNTNAASEPKAYAEFVNEVCKMIKEIDPNHPVGVCNGTYKLFSSYKNYAPEVDVIGMNSYPGPFGFGTLWNRIKLTVDRPVLITEYGTDCYNQRKQKIDEEYQARYHRRLWNDMLANSSWGTGIGNVVGGVVYCWLDRWWLCGSNRVHDVEFGARKGDKADGWIHDEWLGICGQGNGTRTPFKRQLRTAYFIYKELWNQPFPPENENGTDEVDADAADGKNDTPDETSPQND